MTHSDHPAAAFVHAFHADLTHWFAGTDDRAAVWSRLTGSVSDDMVLVYPSGQRLRGEEFLRTIQDRYGTSPGFVASISDLELVQGDANHGVVAYVEAQTGARASAVSNRRSAFALVQRAGDRWVWRFIQETALADQQPSTG